jgi:hypothetical protein
VAPFLASRYVEHPWRKKKNEIHVQAHSLKKEIDGEVTNSADAAKKLPGLCSTMTAKKAYKLQETQEQSGS